MFKKQSTLGVRNRLPSSGHAYMQREVETGTVHFSNRPPSRVSEKIDITFVVGIIDAAHLSDVLAEKVTDEDDETLTEDKSRALINHPDFHTLGGWCAGYWCSKADIEDVRHAAAVDASEDFDA